MIFLLEMRTARKIKATLMLLKFNITQVYIVQEHFFFELFY